MVAPAILLASSFLVLGNPVASSSETFDGAKALEITGFVGTVEVSEGRAFRVEVMGAPEGGPLTVSRDGDTVSITGSEKDVKALYRRGSPWQSNWRGVRSDEAVVKFGKFLEDYPVLSISVPEGTDLTVFEAAMILDAEMSLGEVKLKNLREIYGSVGESDKAYIGIGGTGELSLADVDGALTVAIGGSGDVYVGDSKSATVKIGGSGDVDLGNVLGALDIGIGGSGDVKAGNIGAVTLKVGGSGDVEVDEVSGGISVRISGSGDFSSASIDGDFDVSINGSGDVQVAKGRTTATEISINGSGDVDFGGIAKNPVVVVRGSGDVDIADYEGKVSVKGDKDDIRIGDLDFSDD